MNTLNVKRITKISEVKNISHIFDKESIPYQPVSCVNWIDYPYKPDVKFRIAHDGQNIYINWKVNETDIKAVSDQDLGDVWKDSCVEFFVSFNSPVYYNIETNCIGKVLVETGVDRNNRIRVSKELICEIQRWSSLGNNPISNQSGLWELSLIIPLELFYLDSIKSFDNLRACGNFYKCGDDLSQPHFLSWNPILNDSPNFHLSNFFGSLQFE